MGIGMLSSSGVLESRDVHDENRVPSAHCVDAVRCVMNILNSAYLVYVEEPSSLSTSPPLHCVSHAQRFSV